MRIDLHTHSAVSDGTDAPAELVAQAAATGLDVVALTDHDTFDGLDEAEAAGRTHGIRVVRGIELSTRLGHDSVHLLGYGADETHPELNAELQRVRDGRATRLAPVLELLAGLGVPMTEEQVLVHVGESPSIGRPHIADAMVAAGFVADRREAFDRYLADGGPAHVPRYAIELTSAIDLLHRAGAVAVVAHPWGRGRERSLPEAVLTGLVRDQGLDGLEVDHQDHDVPTRRRLRRLVDRLGVLGTGSSDYHGTGKTDHDLGCNTTDPEVFDRLTDLLSARRSERPRPPAERSPEVAARTSTPRPSRRKAWVVAVANQKGGVAKTTTVASLGAALAQRGLRVLLVDLDPQACLTFSLGYDPEGVDDSVHQVLTGSAAAADVVISTEDGVDLLPATIELATAEQLLMTRTGREQILKTALAPLLSSYDVILLDCPPTLGILTTVALTAAAGVLIPLQCETLSHRGVGQLLDTVHDVKKITNRRLRVIGVLPTLFDARTSHSRLVLDRIGEDYGVPVLEPPIPKSVRFAEAPAVGRSILATAKRSKGATAYRDVADALIVEQGLIAEPGLIAESDPAGATAVGA